LYTCIQYIFVYSCFVVFKLYTYKIETTQRDGVWSLDLVPLATPVYTISILYLICLTESKRINRYFIFDIFNIYLQNNAQLLIFKINDKGLIMALFMRHNCKTISTPQALIFK